MELSDCHFLRGNFRISGRRQHGYFQTGYGLKAGLESLDKREQEFSQEKDYFHLWGEDNILRCLPVGTVAVRLHPDDSLFEVLARIAGVKVCGCKLIVSIPLVLRNDVIDLLEGIDCKKADGGCYSHSPNGQSSDSDDFKNLTYTLRRTQPRPRAVLEEAARKGFSVSRTRVLMEGRIELLQYFREQSISHSFHRYGNLEEHTYL
jgi:RHH-type proline utilization regulon transcriptional repressor/proline dehydrogenase/delta 1-pyrroline-5-carboxylate dehydrogenase